MTARLRDIIRAIRARGGTVENPSSGSHYKAIGPNGRAYTIPAHNGPRTEISDDYIRGLCRAHGYDYKEFCRDL